MSVTLTKVSGRTQALGAVVLPMDRNFSTIQIDAEASAVPAGGSLRLQFVSPGLDKPKDFVGDGGAAAVIDLTKPYPVSFNNLSVDQIIITPVGFDADKTFSVGIVLGGRL